jgi:hypothetical protein
MVWLVPLTTVAQPESIVPTTTQNNPTTARKNMKPSRIE